MESRRINIKISINGKDISRDISPYLKSVRYSDSLDGETNTAEIELEDRERLWIKDWFPQRGDTGSITFSRQNWNGGDEETLELKNLEIDEIENSFPPNECKIKFNSVASNSNLKSVDKSRSWENVKLSKICKDIAEGANLELNYDTAEDPEISRAEQKNESNLKFLHKLCKDKGLIVRVSENQLIVFDAEKLEQADAVEKFSYGDNKLKRFSATATISEIYTAAHVSYSHGKQKETIEHTFEDKSKPSGMTLEINKKVSSKAEAEKLAKKSLRDKNKEEIKIRADTIGNLNYLSGNVITLDDTFGFYAGNYIIEKCDLKAGNGFSCSLELRKCLSGY